MLLESLTIPDKSSKFNSSFRSVGMLSTAISNNDFDNSGSPSINMDFVEAEDSDDLSDLIET